VRRRERNIEEERRREKRVWYDFRDSYVLIWSFFPMVLPTAYK
jgi:hypothetical protein